MKKSFKSLDARGSLAIPEYLRWTDKLISIFRKIVCAIPTRINCA